MARPARRGGESGLVRSCCLGFVLLVVAVGLATYFADRALAGPSLGAPPVGPDDGDSQTQIALTVGARVVAGLAASEHAAVALSERDLTVLIDAHNPHPDRFTNLEARVRDHLLVISADDHAGPFSVTPVLRIALSLQGSSARAIAVRVEEMDVGQLTLPGFMRDRLTGDLPAVLSIPALFGAAPALTALSDNLECVAVTGNTVLIGLHRPGAAAETQTCAGSRA